MQLSQKGKENVHGKRETPRVECKSVGINEYFPSVSAEESAQVPDMPSQHVLRDTKCSLPDDVHSQSFIHRSSSKIGPQRELSTRFIPDAHFLGQSYHVFILITLSPAFNPPSLTNYNYEYMLSNDGVSLAFRLILS